MAVWFTQLGRWDVSGFTGVGWGWPDDVMKPLKEGLKRIVDEVSASLPKSDVPIIEKITFSGDLHITVRDEREGYKGRLFWARSGNLAYSKIRIKQGSVTIVPRDTIVAVSAEYPVYSVNEEIALSEYLNLVLRCSVFQKMLDGLAHEGGTKTRIHPKQFEELKVPFPSIDVQRAIVDKWRNARMTAEEALALADKIEKDAAREFLHGLGLAAPDEAKTRKVFAMHWSEFERWSVRFNQLNIGIDNITKGCFPVISLGKIGRVAYGVQKSPENRPGKHPRPYLRVANVQRGKLDLREIKFLDVPDSDLDTYKLEVGDLLVCEGNSADLVGRPAIWNGEIPDCIHQNHILRVRLDKSIAIPEYVLEFMSSDYARNYFRSRAKFTTNLASINSNDLRELTIPLPPIDKQKILVLTIDKARQQAAAARAKAEDLKARAAAEIEAAILGSASGSI
ncbi:MAG: hypothetical protein ACXWTN_08690 [Methylosarcina sp.]